MVFEYEKSLSFEYLSFKNTVWKAQTSGKKDGGEGSQGGTLLAHVHQGRITAKTTNPEKDLQTGEQTIYAWWGRPHPETPAACGRQAHSIVLSETRHRGDSLKDLTAEGRVPKDWGVDRAPPSAGEREGGWCLPSPPSAQ